MRGMDRAPLVGQNLGARKPERAAKSGWLATLAYSVILLAITAFFLPFAEAIITFFTGEPEVVRHGSNLLRAEGKAVQAGGILDGWG
jgi:Na+-driven multidrug efflux pump